MLEELEVVFPESEDSVSLDFGELSICKNILYEIEGIEQVDFISLDVPARKMSLKPKLARYAGKYQFNITVYVEKFPDIKESVPLNLTVVAPPADLSFMVP